MHDLVRAKGLKQYGGRRLEPGDEILVDAKFTTALEALGVVTVVRRGVDLEAAPAEDAVPDEPAPVKRGRGRPKGSYKRRDP